MANGAPLVGLPAPQSASDFTADLAAAIVEHELGRRVPTVRFVNVDHRSEPTARIVDVLHGPCADGKDAACGSGHHHLAMPDTLLLLPRVFGASSLAPQAWELRARGAIPSDPGPVLVVSSGGPCPEVDAVARRHRGSGDEVAVWDLDLVATATTSHETPTSVELVAALVAAGSVVTDSPDVATLALAYDRPVEPVGDAPRDLLPGFVADDGVRADPRRVAEAVERVDRDFDALAELVVAGPASPYGEEVVMMPTYVEHLEVVTRTQSRRLAEQRAAFGRYFEAFEQEFLARERELRDALTAARAEAAAYEAEVAALRATKVFRYTNRMRGLYRRTRRGAP